MNEESTAFAVGDSTDAADQLANIITQQAEIDDAALAEEAEQPPVPPTQEDLVLDSTEEVNPSDVNVANEINDLINKPTAELSKEEKQKRTGTLREQLQQAESEITKLKEEFEQKGSSFEEVNTSYADIKSKYESVSKELEKANQLINAKDPNTSPEIMRLDQEIKSKWENAITAFPDLQNTFGAMYQDFAKLPFGQEGYAEALRDFKSMVSQISPDFEGKEEQIIGYMREYSQYATTRNEKLTEFNENYEKVMHNHHMEQYEALNSDFKSRSDNWFKAPEGIENTHPDHASVLISKMIENNDADKQYSNKIAEMVGKAFGPQKPLSVEEFKVLDPEEAKKVISESYKKTEEAQKALIDILPQAIFALNKYPQLLVENRNLMDRISSDKESAPPPPSGKVENIMDTGEEDKLLTAAEYNRQIMGG